MSTFFCVALPPKNEDQERSNRPSWLKLSKQLQPNDEVLLRIFADGLDQELCLVHGLVGVVVERAVLKQLADCSFTLVDGGKDRIQPRHGVVELFCKRRITGQLPN